MTPDDFDFSSTTAKILHLGLPGAHKAMDLPWQGDANGWVAVLRKARAVGLSANLELMTTRAERLAELGRPCLPHLDCLIVNDYEIGALAGRETRRPDGSTDPAAVARAIDDVLALGSMRWAAAHFPEGGVVVGCMSNGQWLSVLSSGMHAPRRQCGRYRQRTAWERSANAGRWRSNGDSGR
jgi:hypothetical protein